MEFVEVKKHDFKKASRGKVIRLVNAFAEANIAIAEIKDWEKEYKDLRGAASTFATVIKRCGNGNIKLKRIDNRLYLINELLYKKEE